MNKIDKAAREAIKKLTFDCCHVIIPKSDIKIDYVQQLHDSLKALETSKGTKTVVDNPAKR